MQHIICFFVILLLAAVPNYGQENAIECYMSQKPPGNSPQIFAPGFISTSSDELFGTFSPDYKEFYFIKAIKKCWKIVVSKYNNGEWTNPAETQFSGKYLSKFCLSPDGKTVFLTSFRPKPGVKANKLTTTWFSKLVGSCWSEPEYIPLLDSAFAPGVAANGNIYFHKLGENQQDIYMSVYDKGRYKKPVKLGDGINSVTDEADPWIAPDESYILFSREYKGSTGLFISFRVENNWTDAIPLGKEINDIKPVNAGSVTPDGKYIMLFSNHRADSIKENEKDTAGKESIDIYWVSSDIISKLRPGKCHIENFYPDIISLNGRSEGNLSYSKSSKTFIYRVFDPLQEDPIKLISHSKKKGVDIILQKPDIDSKYREWDFNFDRSGKNFYFTSDRPLDHGGTIPLADSKIWKVRYRNGKWGIPFPLPSPVNKDSCFSGYPALSINNRMYFHSDRKEGYGRDDIFYCNTTDNSFSRVTNPGYPINTEYSDRDPAISPDDSLIVFFSDRPGGSFADGDMYLCTKDGSGSWNRPLPLGGLIGYAGHPYISDDGKTLYFTSLAGADTDIFMVELERLLLVYTKFLQYKIASKTKIIAPDKVSTSDDEVPLKALLNNTIIFSRTPVGFSCWKNEPVFFSGEDETGWGKPVKIDNNNSDWPENLPSHLKVNDLVVSKWVDLREDRMDIDIKIIEFDRNGSVEVIDPGYPVNSEYIDSWPARDKRGDLYFFSNRPGGQGDLDIYMSKYKDSSYLWPVNMGYPINTKWREHDPAISTDGTCLVFASDRKGGFGGDDLYICFRLDDGTWSVPFNLGPEVNTENDENRPVMNNSGRSIYFASNRKGNLDIYSVTIR